MSTDVAAPEETTPVDQSPPARQRSPLRTILFIVLAIAVIALLIDYRARFAAAGLNSSLEEMLDQARVKPAGGKPTLEDVHESIGHEPDAAYEHQELEGIKVEEYRYQGAVRKYTVYVYYQTSPDVRLYTSSLNQPLTKADL